VIWVPDNPIFTIVIPLIPQHDFEIKRILKLLTNEQHLIKEVIICRSETKGSTPRVRKRYLNYAKSVGFVKEIKIDTVKSVARDGTNRNRGWKSATSKYVAFMDADDLYSVGRLSILLELFNSSNADGILHSYGSLSSPDEIFDLTKHPAKKVLVKKDENGVDYLVDMFGNELKVHFAHITVRNEVKDSLMFTDRFPGADWEFATQLVSRGFNVEYLSQELSAWSRNRSIRYKVRLYRMRLLRRFVKSMK
jgi:glycosyltransferase involved in cell wall biosynthesis